MTSIDFDSLPLEQQESFLASPMSQAELDRLAICEAQLVASHKAQLKAELVIGEALAELKNHPKLLWQRSDIFRTKTGRWKKRRNWGTYVLANGLAESVAEADRLIAQWKQFKMFDSLDHA